ncbi:MAG: MOSC domain-containing protein [Gammaproteobacteria bacterium]|nr:MOSC domain-containing protein [Gammaproteobacteria bacterium]MBQ0840016.1 MOSC domain-containing protein [Gammaproteobacteria bacterium]
MHIQGLYCGQSQILQPGNEATGIFKKPVSQVAVDELGIKGDVQVDKRYHGGPDKALHQYSLASYRRIVAAYPDLDGVAVPGSMGENISIGEMAEATVCIGDIYRFGAVLVQVSEPRRPCWKINTKFEHNDLSEFIEHERITGWYYRVLEAGDISVGDGAALLERPNPRVNIDYFNTVLNMAQPSRSKLVTLIDCAGLANYLRVRLEEKSAQLPA